MKSTAINQRVVDIKNDKDEISKFVEEYKPFIAAFTKTVARRYVRYGEDDELSIAMIAFAEAIKSFDFSKGSFLPFSQMVMKNRLIDYFRKEKHHRGIISINEYIDEEGNETDLTDGASVEKFEVDSISEYRRLEIEQLTQELLKWDISMLDLVDASPKQEKTRKACKEITKFLLAQPELLSTLKNKRYLPIIEIEKALNLPRKIIERSRKYIIAVVLIATGDYQYIKDYIKV